MSMALKGINYAKRFSGMLASLTTFLCSIIIFVKSSEITLDVLLYALSIIVPAAVLTGLLGYYIGKIFDSTRKKRKLKKFIK